jgi:hypothetical protein
MYIRTVINFDLLRCCFDWVLTRILTRILTKAFSKKLSTQSVDNLDDSVGKPQGVAVRLRLLKF